MPLLQWLYSLGSYGEWGAYPPEYNSHKLFDGPGPEPMLQTAESFRQMRDTLATLASDVDSLLMQLRSTWRGDAADRGEQAFRQYSAGLREMAAAADAAAQQAQAQAAANASARSSMPKEEAIHIVHHELRRAVATGKFMAAQRLRAEYQSMWSQAAATMSAYEAATVPNMRLPSPRFVPPIVNPGPIINPSPSASDSIAKLTDLLNGLPAQPFTPPTATDTPPSSSSTLDELNGGTAPGADSGLGGAGGGSSGAGGGLGGAGGIGLLPGAMSGRANGFQLPQGWLTQPGPRGFGLPGGVPAMPMAGGAAPGTQGAGARTRRDREKERESALLDGAVVAPDISGEVPEIAGLGVVEAAEPDDELAAPNEVAAPTHPTA